MLVGTVLNEMRLDRFDDISVVICISSHAMEGALNLTHPERFPQHFQGIFDLKRRRGY